MDFFSLEEIFSSGGELNSPGAQIYLYRFLQILASRESRGSGPLGLSYDGAKKLAHRLELVSPEKLIDLFRELGLGSLDFRIDDNNIQVTLTPSALPFVAGNKSSGKGTDRTGCELEHGLIDGMLEAFTSLPVTTVETACWTRGDKDCRFEASRVMQGGVNAYRPVSAVARTSIIPREGLAKPGGADVLLRSWSLDAISREIARSERHGRPLSLLYVDLDDLGEINVSYGMEAGDQVIKAVASALSRCCRMEDFLWHHGEDEFVIALAETDTNSAELVAQRLNIEILTAAEYVDVAATISASIGYSTYPTHAEDLSSLLSSARSALYLAKSLGKGRAQAARHEGKVEVKTKPPADVEAEEKKIKIIKTEVEPEEPEGKQVAGEPAGLGDDTVKEQMEEKLETSVSEHEQTASSKVTDETSIPRQPPAMEGINVVSILAASSSPLLLAGMKQVLSEAEDMKLAGEVVKPDRLPDVVADIRPDVIFADIQMAAAKRYAALKELKEKNLPCKFAVFVAEVDQDVLRVAADFDADGVILQSSKPSEVLESLREIYKGRKLLPEEIRSAIDELENNRRLLKELSERELEVLRLVAEGKSNSLISKELFITINTVRFHLANIYQKLNVSNRTEAANYYLRQGLNADGQTKLL